MIPSDLLQTQLADAASVLLFGGDDDRRSEAAVTSLDRLFRDITGLRENTIDPRDRSAISVPAGSAISPLDAGRCLLDTRRTVAYLRGVYDAIQEAQKRFPGQVIHVLYAGCGPFAPLCLPLLPLLAGQAVHFTLLDVHARAVESVQAILAALGLRGMTVNCLVCDATHYHHSNQRPLHVVVSETMQRALEKEPQVAILMNTARQLTARGLMVPEMIAVDAVLTDLSRELGGNGIVAAPWNGRIPLGRILEVDRERASAWAAARVPSHLPPARIVLPSVVAAQHSLVLAATIRTFGVHVLREYESGLTHPLTVNGWRTGEEIEVTYHLGDKPGFRLARTRHQDGTPRQQLEYF
jgi:fumarate reductase subunit D